MSWADAAWYDARWQSIPAEQRERIVAFLRERLSERQLEQIREWHAEDPTNWATKGPQFFHMFGGGMAARNLLRELMPDDELPLAPYRNGEEYANWDDYYVQALEAAAGSTRSMRGPFVRRSSLERLQRRRQRDALHLMWIRGRLIHRHGENPNVDYILRLEQIAETLNGGRITMVDRLLETDVHATRGEVLR